MIGKGTMYPYIPQTNRKLIKKIPNKDSLLVNRTGLRRFVMNYYLIICLHRKVPEPTQPLTFQLNKTLTRNYL